MPRHQDDARDRPYGRRTVNTIPDSPTRPFVARWDLVVDGDGFSTHSSHLLPVLHDGLPAMLKVARSDEERRGNSVMVSWDGRGAARVLEHDGPALVLERATGPRSLTAQATDGAGSLRWTLADARATRVLCTVARDLHAVGASDAVRSTDLVPLDRWFRDLLVSAGTHRGFVRRAATTARDLLDERRDTVVLHGDVHHANVLDFGDAAAPRWKAIDPKGLVGDRAFDYANMLCNPTHAVALLPGRLERQVEVVAHAAGLGTERLLRWVVAWTGLSAVWFSAAGPGWMSSSARDDSTASVLATGRTAEELLR